MILGTQGDTYAEEMEVDADLCGDIGVIGFWAPRRMCVFDIQIFDTTTD